MPRREGGPFPEGIQEASPAAVWAGITELADRQATLTVRQALSERLRRVGRRQRPEPAVLEGASLFAVFEDPEAGEGFLGLATLREVARWPDRIFADLVSAPPELALAPEAV